jgi:hypothetical protein
MNSPSSSPATSNPSPNTSSGGPPFAELQPFDLAIVASQSCPPSITTSPAFSPLSDSDPFLAYFGDVFHLTPPMPTSSLSPSPASRTSMSDTELLGNCNPIRQNVQAGTPSSFLFPSSFQQMNGHIPVSTSSHHVPGAQRSDSGQVEYLNLREPRPPDCFINSTGSAVCWQIPFGFPFQAGDTEESSMKPSSLTIIDAGGDERPLAPSRGRRSRSVPNLEAGTDSIPVKTGRHRAPYPSRSPSRKPPEPQGGFRARVSTEAFKKVSDGRRTAPAPHQCPLCSDTFTRADGLQSKSWELSGSLR